MKEEYEDLIICPEGWVDNLVFELGRKQRCGKAIDGMGIRINNDGGGVLTRESMKRIRDEIDKHLKVFPIPHSAKRSK